MFASIWDAWGVFCDAYLVAYFVFLAIFWIAFLVEQVSAFSKGWGADIKHVVIPEWGHQILISAAAFMLWPWFVWQTAMLFLRRSENTSKIDDDSA